MILLACLLLFLSADITAQADIIPVAKHTTKQNRANEYQSLLNSIATGMDLPLSDATEDFWLEAFDAMELLSFRSPAADVKIRSVFDSLLYRSDGFQRSFLELIYANYPKDFVPQVVTFVNKTSNPKLFAMCSEYLLVNNKQADHRDILLQRMQDKIFNEQNAEPFFTVLQNKLSTEKPVRPPVADLLQNDFLPDETVLFSFQRKNRNYPGLAMVRGKDGLFIKDEDGNYFAVPQLARSMSNMPGYITNGNTPQGIFKTTGFAISKGSFIGPTTNLQMVLPYEQSADVPDSVTRVLGDNYSSLLPASWKNYFPFFEAYYAGRAGRSEIIAHGTTMNPVYYKKQIYYPISPTQGCLCTKEIWSAIDGRRTASDQQRLVNAVKKAGGPQGYCIVVEIDDQQKPVSIHDILPLLNQQ